MIQTLNVIGTSPSVIYFCLKYGSRGPIFRLSFVLSSSLQNAAPVPFGVSDPPVRHLDPSRFKKFGESLPRPAFMNDKEVGSEIELTRTAIPAQDQNLILVYIPKVASLHKLWRFSQLKILLKEMENLYRIKPLLLESGSFS